LIVAVEPFEIVMPDKVADILSALLRSGQTLESALRASAADHSQRPRLLAEALRSLGVFPAYACLLSSDGIAALDGSGTLHADWGESLRKTLESWAQSGADGEPSVLVKPPGLATSLIGVPLIARGWRFGAVAVGCDSKEENVAAVLALFAGKLAAQLALEEQRGGSEEIERQQWLASVSETTSIVAHEFNNFLNGMMLHMALIQQGAAREMTRELDVIKRLATDAANLVKKLQQYNSRQRSPLAPTDLNATIREAFAGREPPPSVTEIDLELAENLPPVQATRRDLGRLLDLLFRQSAAAQDGKPGPIRVCTDGGGRKPILRFEDSGPPIDAESLSRVFEPFFVARPGTPEPGLALCQTLARRLQASVRVENRPEGGVAFILEFAPSTPAK
jgi:signal transduction histidine kinase